MIFGSVALTLVRITACVVTGAATAPTAVPILMRFENLHCRIRTLEAVYSRADFERLSLSIPPEAPVPVPAGVDWEKHILLVAGSGRRRREGFAIRIERVEKMEDALVVQVKEIIPPDDAPQREATFPTDVVAVPRVMLPVRFVVNGFVERVARPSTSRPAETSYVDRDAVLSRFQLTAEGRQRLEEACRTFVAAHEATQRWLAAHASEKDAREQYQRRLETDIETFDAAVRRVLSPEQYAIYLRARYLRAVWRQKRQPLLDLARHPNATETERGAYLEQVRALDARLQRDVDALFPPTPTTQPAVSAP